MLLKRLGSYYFIFFLLLTKSSIINYQVFYIDTPFKNEHIPIANDNLFLTIPKLDLNVMTTFNTKLDEGLQIHELSTRPDENQSTLIIMGHAGIGQNVYFNNLIKLDINDLISIEYGARLYNYVIENKKIIDKGNKYSFEFNNNKLYLITCYHHNKQIVLKAKRA